MAAKRKKTKKKSGKKKSMAVLVVGFILGIAVTVAAVMSYEWVLDNKIPAFKKTGVIRIYPTTTMEDLMVDISSALEPRFPRSIERVLEQEDVAASLRPGNYVIRSNQPARYLARAITRGWQNPVNLVLSGSIRNKKVLAEKISSQMMVDEKTALAALNDSLLLARFGTTPQKLFEMIIPDTYQMYWDASMEKILERLKGERDKFWDDERIALAKKQGLTPEKVSVLASIVAEESHIQSEYPKVAAVYLNRLHKGMKLQACPTVCYIYDYKIKRVLYRHINTPSPYNTYLNYGLPPSPICVPDKNHIDAVLHPSAQPYLYFCADPSFNGRNVFSTSFSEHQKNAAAYQAAYTEKYGKGN